MLVLQIAQNKFTNILMNLVFSKGGKIMGCWGITAFESDAGLDAIHFIRRNLPNDGSIDLGKIIEVMQRKKCRIYDVTDGESHSGPMALAELIVKFHDKDFSDLDDERNNTENKFSNITCFSASKESLQWLRDYLFDTLKYARENADFRSQYGVNWGGWFEEADWHEWQSHMSMLVSKIDTYLASPNNLIDLIRM